MNKKEEKEKEAMKYKRKEHDKYMQWKKEGQKTTPSPRRYNNKREEKVPDWFYKKDEEKPKKTKKPNAEIAERRRKLQEELNAMRNEVK